MINDSGSALTLPHLINRSGRADTFRFTIPVDPARRRANLRTLVNRLPVFPTCAAEVIRIANRERLTAERLVSLASRDQVLAGGILHVANSARYTWSGNVGTLKEAVMYLGEVGATQVLISCAMKAILGVIGHQKLWDHSMEAASVAQRIAAESQMFDASSAYILGLLHDVGKLIFRLASTETQSRLDDLVSMGCERRVAELVVFGATHARVGADVLKYWQLPNAYAKAMEFHHDPEMGGELGSALLYLASSGQTQTETAYTMTALRIRWRRWRYQTLLRMSQLARRDRLPAAVSQELSRLMSTRLCMILTGNRVSLALAFEFRCA